MTNLERIVQPTEEQFREASEVCYTRFEYQRHLDSPARFAAFQAMGVELAALRSGDQMQCVGFLVPSELEVDGETLRWYYMFQVASRPTAAGAGGLLIRQIMQWYPSIFGMGITPDAEKLYKAFRWQPFPGFARAVHPIDLKRFVTDYGKRIANPWLRQTLSLSSGVYNALNMPLEWLLSRGRSAAPWVTQEGKPHILSTYLPLFRMDSVAAANVGGVARLLTPPNAGSLSDHAAVWRALRRQRAKACEMLLFSEQGRREAIRRGYIPVPLQVWCWDKQQILARAIPILKERGMTFLDTDKTV